jgi:sugar lactone lactonase YvrE
MKDGGVIFSLPVGGGTPTILSGTELTSARSVDLVQKGGADVLYFTGKDKTTGAPGVFTIPASGGAVTKVASGMPFNDPAGVAAASDGTVYVADTVAAATLHASIIKIAANGTASVLFPDLRVGYPAGLALSKDEKTLYVSSLDPVKLTDQLLEIDVSNGMMSGAVTAGINMNYEAAGIHRAHNFDIFAWADTKASPMGLTGTGTVFVIK